MTIDKHLVRNYFTDLQNRIVQGLEDIDGRGNFHADAWDREEGGSGDSRVMSDGAVFEKAGVNFSHVMGASLPASATAQRPQLAGRRFEAMGVSLVLHPENPYVPTTHANVRFFVAEADDAEPVWWFGGGFDLTPYYGFEEDAVHWHSTARKACEGFGENRHAELKQACDEYFYLRHRAECRSAPAGARQPCRESSSHARAVRQAVRA